MELLTRFKEFQGSGKQTRGDTAQENVFRYLYWGGDTAHNTTYYLESGGGDTAQENVFRCSHWGGDTAQNPKKGGGTPHKIQSRLLAGWLGCTGYVVAGWLAGWLVQ